MTIQVQIRQIGGGDVSLEDCARFSQPMGEAIETAQLLNEAYVLEVSSPGISEELISDRDFQTFKGFPVEVILKKASDDSEFRRTGLLHHRSNDHVQLNIKGRIDHIPRKDVMAVSLITPGG